MMARMRWLLGCALIAGCTVRGGPITCPSPLRPAARSQLTPVLVAATDQIYALGGANDMHPIDDLWRWSFGSCGGWQPLSLASSPGPRAGYAAAFDDKRQRILYIGGTGATQDVWALDTDRLIFTKLQAVGTPPPPAAVELAAFDSLHDRVIYVGVETFALDFTGSDQGQWRLVAGSSATAPASATVDPTRSLMLILDGAGLHGFAFYTGTWRDLTVGGDAPTAGARLAWDVTGARLLAIGDGVWAGALDANGTAVAFTRLAISGAPPPRSDFAAVVSGDRVWLFGGANARCSFDDVWQLSLSTNAWTNLEPATSCP